MGQSYSNQDPSPAPGADKASFHWRDDIREYDTVPFRPDILSFPFYYEDMDLMFTQLKYLPNFYMQCRPSILISVLIVIILNLAPIGAYIYWSVNTDGKHLWTLSLVPVYLALNALLPLVFNKVQEKVMLGSKKKRAQDFRTVLAKLNERCFSQKGYRAEYSVESFILSIKKA